MVKVEYEHDEATQREAELKEQMASQLREKDDELIREHARATNASAQLEHSKVQHQLTTDRALASKEHARVAEEHA